MSKPFNIKLIFRTSLLVVVLLFLCLDYSFFSHLFSKEIGPFKIYHFIWLLLLIEMALVIFPKSNTRIGCGKLFQRHFEEAEGYSKGALRKISTRFNKRVIIVAVIWFLLLSNIGLLYKFQVIKNSALFLISLAFYFLDQLFIVVWCPFKELILRNKCCNNCRIYNWGHFMMFSPLVFINSVYTQFLFWISVLILIQWEIQNIRHPERFHEISNLNLRCKSCDSACEKNKN